MSALAGPSDLVLSDQLNHASIIDGCRLSRSTVSVFEHCSVEDVARQLESRRSQARRAFVVTESYFGMDATTSQAVIIYDAALSRDKGKRVETRRFEARQSVGEIDGRSSGTALNQAANKVADEVAAWVASLQPSP